MNEKTSLTDSSDGNLNRVYLIGAITTMIVLSGIVLDIVVGSITGGNLQLCLSPLLTGLFNCTTIH